MSYTETICVSPQISTPLYCPEPIYDETQTAESPVLPLTFDQLYTSARNSEQKSHFTAIASTLESKKSAHTLSSLSEATTGITTALIEKEKSTRLYHLICRLRALDPQFPQESLFERPKIESETSSSVEEICAALGIAILPESKTLIATFCEQEKRIADRTSPSYFASEKTKFTTALSSLERLMLAPPQETEELEDRNKDILRTLRAIYSSPLYEALCMSDLPLIDILHSVAIGQYTNTILAPAFEQIGQVLQESQPPLPKRIDDIWKRLQTVGIDDGFFTTLLHYSFRLLIKIGLPYLALKIAQIFSLNCLIPYIGDERSILGNTPGSLTDEIQSQNGQWQRKIRTVVLSAPTLGYEIAPEFRAALQALENNQFSTTEDQFLTWAYTNLQNISFTPEHPSTIALMHLQSQYPLSFQAITLPQRLPDFPSLTFSQDDVHHHLSLLFKEQTSSLENRGIHEDSGYYFPKRFLDQFQQEIKAIAADAYRIIDQNRGIHTPSELKMAFVKLFHLGLTRLHERETFARTAIRTARKALSTIRSTICASCVDRGGLMNAAYLKALDPHEELKIFSTGTYFGRAILSQRRCPAKKSVKGLSTLFSVLPSHEVTQFLSRLSPEGDYSLTKSKIS